MTVDTLLTEVPSTDSATSDGTAPSVESTPFVGTPAATPPKKATAKKAKTIQLTLTVTGSADGEWHAELKQGSTFLARNLEVAAAAVARAANELHEELSTPINQIIDEARSQQAAKVAALEAELEAARRALAGLD